MATNDAELLRLKAEAEYEYDQKNKPSTSDVAKNSAIQGGAGVVDSILNFPSNLKNVGKMGAEFMDYAFGPVGSGADIPSDYGQFDIPEDSAKNYLTGQGLLDPNMRQRMSPEQKIADTAIQGAIGAAGGGAKAALVAGLSAMAGETVSQATGNEALGLSTSVLAPSVGSKISALNRARIEAEAMNAVRDKTLADARSLDMIVIPDNRVVDFASRPKLLQAAKEINQKITNKVSASYAGLPPNTAVSREGLDAVRKNAYKNGYEPLKRTGTVTTDNDYLNDLIDIETEFTGQSGSFPDAVSKNLVDLVQAYTVPKFEANDVIDKIRTLRNRATKFINSDVPDNEEYGLAMKKVADAMESQLERHLQRSNLPPELMANYRAARRQIARTHSVESALHPGSGDVDMTKLGKLYEKGIPIDGDLEKVARFASINRPKTANPNTAGEPQKTPYSHLAGAGLAGGAAMAMDLPFWAVGPLAAGGAWAGREAHNILAAPVRGAITSRLGQEMLAPNYSALGIDPRTGPLSGLMFQNSRGDSMESSTREEDPLKKSPIEGINMQYPGALPSFDKNSKPTSLNYNPSKESGFFDPALMAGAVLAFTTKGKVKPGQAAAKAYAKERLAPDVVQAIEANAPIAKKMTEMRNLYDKVNRLYEKEIDVKIDSKNIVAKGLVGFQRTFEDFESVLSPNATAKQINKFGRSAKPTLEKAEKQFTAFLKEVERKKGSLPPELQAEVDEILGNVKKMEK